MFPGVTTSLPVVSQPRTPSVEGRVSSSQPTEKSPELIQLSKLVCTQFMSGEEEEEEDKREDTLHLALSRPDLIHLLESKL